jgi:hypothetical protein
MTSGIRHPKSRDRCGVVIISRLETIARPDEQYESVNISRDTYAVIIEHATVDLAQDIFSRLFKCVFYIDTGFCACLDEKEALLFGPYFSLIGSHFAFLARAARRSLLAGATAL